MGSRPPSLSARSGWSDKIHQGHEGNRFGVWRGLGVLFLEGRGDEARAHGMQQHPQQTRTPGKQVRDDKRAMSRPFYFPNMSVIHFSMGLSIPESSAIWRERARRPARALVTDPSGAVLLGMKAQL